MADTTAIRHAERAWIELNLSHLKHNVAELRRVMAPGCELMAVLKAEAYGHGMLPVADALCEMGVTSYAVATIDEGIVLREHGIKEEILILGYTDPRRAIELHNYSLSQTVFDLSYAEALAAEGKAISVHIAIDSGMHRLGIAAEDVDAVALLFTKEPLAVHGIFSHLCVSDSDDEEDIAYTKKQLSAFSALLDALVSRGITLPKVHIQNSYGLLNYTDYPCDYARIGISLYGVDSEHGLYRKANVDLKPVLSLRSKVIQLRSLPKGEPVGYGRAFITERDSRIAVLPIGYADGLPRTLSGGKGQVLLNGKRAPIIGRVCMDQVIVDVTDIPDVVAGTVATLIGTDGNETIAAEDMAEACGTITNDLLSRLGRRLIVETIR